MYWQELELRKYRRLTTIIALITGALPASVVAAGLMMREGHFSLTQFGYFLLSVLLFSAPISLIIGHNFQRTNGKLRTLLVWIGSSAFGIFLGMQLWSIGTYWRVATMSEHNVAINIVEMTLYWSMFAILLGMFIIIPATISTLMLGRRWNLHKNIPDSSMIRCLISAIIIGLYAPIIVGLMGDIIEIL